jgi:hypothetical protein
MLTVLAGCSRRADGPERFAVRGNVTWNGQPLPAGHIRFVPMGNTKGPAAVGSISQGAYAISRAHGPVPGLYRVEIESAAELPFAIDDEQAFAQAAAQAQTTRKPIVQQPLPPQYNRQSTLTAEVTATGDNRFDFKLPSARAASHNIR